MTSLRVQDPVGMNADAEKRHFAFDPRETLGLYVHLPFCASRCGYCDFAVVTEKDDNQGRYVDCLIRELEYWSTELERPVGTLYFGGGTPSRLHPDEWRRLFAAIREKIAIRRDVEISAEANPESLSEEVLERWKELGINRISLGVQSFQPDYLSLLDRRHSAEVAVEAIHRIRQAGFKNWSLDLIYGLPRQDTESWMRDLDTALALEAPHLSFYNLILHKNLPVTIIAMSSQREREEEIHAELFLKGVEKLEASGYEVYELSNAAKPGARCRHNSLYWRGGEWIGIGVSASGYFRGQYFSNPPAWDAYLARWERVNNKEVIQGDASLSENLLPDAVMLHLRTVEGISLEELESLRGGPLPDGFSKFRADLEGYGYIRDAPEKIALTPAGWLLHSEITNRVLQELGIEGRRATT